MSSEDDHRSAAGEGTSAQIACPASTPAVKTARPSISSARFSYGAGKVPSRKRGRGTFACDVVFDLDRLNTRKSAASASDAEREPEHRAVRLDKWLWAARFYRTRSAAAAAIDAGRVRVNEQRVKPAKAMRVEDLVAMRDGGIEREVRVRILADVRVAAGIAQMRYAETETSLAAR